MDRHEVISEIKKIVPVFKLSCPGCQYDSLGQKHHMEAGGCLFDFENEIDEYELSTHLSAIRLSFIDNSLEKINLFIFSKYERIYQYSLNVHNEQIKTFQEIMTEILSTNLSLNDKVMILKYRALLTNQKEFNREFLALNNNRIGAILLQIAKESCHLNDEINFKLKKLMDSQEFKEWLRYFD